MKLFQIFQISQKTLHSLFVKHANNLYLTDLLSALFIRMGCECIFDRPTIYIAPLPRAISGGEGWVANMTHYGCCYYARMQERNPFGQPSRRS